MYTESIGATRFAPWRTAEKKIRKKPGGQRVGKKRLGDIDIMLGELTFRLQKIWNWHGASRWEGGGE